MSGVGNDYWSLRRRLVPSTELSLVERTQVPSG